MLVSTLAAIAIGVPVGIAAARRRGLADHWRRWRASSDGAESCAVRVPAAAAAARWHRAGSPWWHDPPRSCASSGPPAGLRSIDPAILEAADAMGMTTTERLFQVELPLALPTMSRAFAWRRSLALAP